MMMLSMQMQQQIWKFSMQLQIFQQQIQMQLAVMEKCAETSEKYLCRIAKRIVVTRVREARLMMTRQVLMMTNKELKFICFKIRNCS